MDTWNDILERMKAHTPLTPLQARDEAEAAKKARDEITSVMAPRLNALKAGIAVGLVMLIVGYVWQVDWLPPWVLPAAGVLIFGYSAVFAAVTSEVIQLADARFSAAWHSSRLISAKKAAEIADLSERSPEFAKIVEGWLEVCGTLTSRESSMVSGAEEAFDRYQAEQRVRISAGAGVTDRAA